MPIPEYHLFRYVDDEEVCHGDRTHRMSALQTPLHHSGACWCRQSNGDTFTVPERNGQGSGVGYLIRRVEPDEREGMFCGDSIHDNVNHIHFQPRNANGQWFHHLRCWCRITGEAHDVNEIIDERYPHAVFNPSRGVELPYPEDLAEELRNAESAVARVEALTDRIVADISGRLTSRWMRTYLERLDPNIATGMNPLYRCRCGFVGYNPQASQHSERARTEQSHRDQGYGWQNTGDHAEATRWIAEALIRIETTGISEWAAVGANEGDTVQVPELTMAEHDALGYREALGFHLLRPAVARDARFVALTTTEAHSGSCWCQYTTPRNWEVPANNYYIRRVGRAESTNIIGVRFNAMSMHIYVIVDGEHSHDMSCWCMLRTDRQNRLSPRDLFNSDYPHRIETSQQAETAMLIERDFVQEINDEDPYEEEEPQHRADPLGQMAGRPERTGGFRHLFRPDGEYVRHTSACWCQHTESGRSMDFSWPVLNTGGSEVILDVWQEDVAHFVGRPVDFNAQSPIHMFTVGRNGNQEHFASCWCRLRVPIEGLSIRNVPNNRTVFHFAQRAGYGELGTQGERWCFSCGWQAHDHELRRTKKGFVLRCPKEKNPDMNAVLNITPPVQKPVEGEQ